MKISVIIPAYNSSSSLVKTVESIFNQSYPKDEFEVIVVDDGSTDATKEDMERLRRQDKYNLGYCYQKNRGPAAARNLGIKNSRGEIIVFIDADCIADRSWLKEISGGYNDQRLAGIGGVIKAVPSGSIVSRYCAYIKMNEKPKRDKTGIVYLITANASFRKSCLDSIGGFDQRYNSPGGEDPDLCYRLRKEGYYFKYNPKAVVFNPHKNSFKELAGTYFNYGRGESFLALRKTSRWRLSDITGWKWVFYFSKIIFKAILMAMEDAIDSILRLLKVPFRILTYYSQGLSLKESLSYALLDYLKDFSFQQGCLMGYLEGKFKGFSKLS
ncbi:MAG: glycosyltransferase [Candidatus Omnitrophota bacterium]|jgi:glycosyltransferase involved in cell wall biosynthesis